MKTNKLLVAVIVAMTLVSTICHATIAWPTNDGKILFTNTIPAPKPGTTNVTATTNTSPPSTWTNSPPIRTNTYPQMLTNWWPEFPSYPSTNWWYPQETVTPPWSIDVPVPPYEPPTRIPGTDGGDIFFNPFSTKPLFGHPNETSTHSSSASTNGGSQGLPPFNDEGGNNTFQRTGFVPERISTIPKDEVSWGLQSLAVVTLRRGEEVERFSHVSASGIKDTNWTQYGQQLLLKNGDTINIHFNPLQDWQTEEWVAFNFVYDDTTTNLNVPAIMPPGMSIGSWTVVIQDNPLSIHLTNAVFSKSIGYRNRSAVLKDYTLPSGINAVGGPVDLLMKISAVTTGETYTVEYKTDLNDPIWTPIMSVTTDLENTDGYGNLYIPISSGGLTNLFLRAHSASDVSLIIGYVTVGIPAGKSALIANQFVPMDSRISRVFAGATSGDYIEQYYPGQGWVTNSFNGEWSDGTEMFYPGVGGLYHNTSANDITVTFSGIVLEGGLGKLVAGGSSVQSYLFPRSYSMKWFPIEEGDTVYKFDPATESYATYTYISNEWAPSTPIFSLGEAFAVDKAPLTNDDWVWPISYEAYPVLEGPFTEAITNYMYDQFVDCPRVSEPVGTNYLLVRSLATSTLDVQTSESLIGSWTTEAVVEVGPSHVAVVPIPANDRQRLFFRLQYPSQGITENMMMRSSSTESEFASTSLSAMTTEVIGAGAPLKEKMELSPSYYSWTHPEWPPMPGNEFALPEWKVDSTKIVVDDRALETLRVEDAKALDAVRQRALSKPLPAWLKRK